MLKLKGHSGCSVTLREENNNRTVIKSTNDKSYIPRLTSQSKKQQNFGFCQVERSRNLLMVKIDFGSRLRSN